VTLAISLDDYLFGALAAESSIENEFAALKAQAVVSRTYALAKLRRHARDGFDFCNTTHCQRFLPVRAENARPDFHELVRRAVRETTGEVLRDGRGNLAREIYFSASCGGQTANFQTLWGRPAREPYQRGGVPDEYCAAMPHKRWTIQFPPRNSSKRCAKTSARMWAGASSTSPSSSGMRPVARSNWQSQASGGACRSAGGTSRSSSGARSAGACSRVRALK
jgi:SpoIID/LytB domain protein